jgi:hypothetical protein
VTQEGVAEIGELDAARQSIEQAHAQFLFQELDALGQAGLGDAELGGSQRDVAPLGDASEILQLPQIQGRRPRSRFTSRAADAS